MKRIFVLLAIWVVVVVGCGPVDSWDAPKEPQACHAGDPRLRPDGVCCPVWEPDWRGPDRHGYYCQPKRWAADDPLRVTDPL